MQLAAPFQEDPWRTAGFRILAQEPGGVLVLFSDDAELKAFRRRLAEYRRGRKEMRRARPIINSSLPLRTSAVSLAQIASARGSVPTESRPLQISKCEQISRSTSSSGMPLRTSIARSEFRRSWSMLKALAGRFYRATLARPG